nr:response regulator [Methanocalculus alkaliphilus]
MGGQVSVTGNESRLRFFIVEDNAIIAFDLERRVETLGHTVVGSADTAETAIRGILETLPDCVLMDIRLKGEGDGIMVAEEIQRTSPRPIAFLTAYSDKGMLQQARATGPTACIIKPVRDQDLHQLISRIRSG